MKRSIFDIKKEKRRKRKNEDKGGGSNPPRELLPDALSNFSTMVFMLIYPPYRYAFMRESPLGV